MEYKVYMHINRINQKKYIGQTKQSLSRRFRTNGEGYLHCTAFYNAIQKYGWDNFDHILIQDGLTAEEANNLEKQLIEQYQTTNQNYGYNISFGGEQFINSQQLSEYNRQRWLEGVYDNLKTAVYCVELNQFYESAIAAERDTGIDNSGIQKVCKKQLKYAGIYKGQPLHWIYADQVTDENINELKNKKEILKGVGIPIYCPELNQLFSSASEAQKIVKVDASFIRKAATGKAKSAGKHPVTQIPLHWIEKPELLTIGYKLLEKEETQWHKRHPN